MSVYAHVNTFPHGSTGGIMMREHRELLVAGQDSYAFWGRGRTAEGGHEMRFAAGWEVRLDGVQTRIDGKAGFHSKVATRRLLTHLDKIKPEVVHLHNLHGYYINVEMLFEWLASHDCRIEWTLHDCWAFTGHCAYFTYAKCEQWKTRCAYAEPCPQLATYPKTISKASCKWSYEQKKRLFCLVPVERMKLITPSQWLADLVGESFLAKYPVEVRHNTIDTDVFKPTPSDFREKHDIGERFMILGVASPWTERKGLADFMRLAGELDCDKYVIVLVGLSAKQIKQLPERVIGLTRTDSPQELAGIYSTADVFFNPTREDNYPTTLLEAQSCGTDVLTYLVGGCEEALYCENSKGVATISDALQVIKGMAATHPMGYAYE